MSSRIKLLLASIGVFFLLPPAVALGETDFGAGLTLRQTYDDNLFLTHETEKTDLITNVNPFVFFSYGGKKVKARFDYSLALVFYSKYREENETSIGDTQRIEAALEAEPLKNLKVKVTDEYKRVAVDTRGPDEGASNIVNKTERNRLESSASYLLELPARFAFDVSGKYVSAEHPNLDDADDTESMSGRAELSKGFAGNGSIYAGYNRENFKADISSDYSKEGYFGGLVFQPTRRIEMRGEAGLDEYDYTEQEDSTLRRWEAGVLFNVSENSLLSYSYSNDLSHSLVDGYRKTIKNSLAWSYKLRHSFSLSAFSSRDDYLSVSRREEVTGAGADVVLAFSKKISLSLGGEYSKALYSDAGVEEDVLRRSANGALHFAYRYFNLSLGYEFSDRDGEGTVEDYVVNRAYAQLGVEF